MRGPPSPLREQIADFGFATIGEPSKKCQSIVGSKTYMAPEVMGHQSHPDLPLGYNGASVSLSQKVRPYSHTFVFVSRFREQTAWSWCEGRFCSKGVE